MEGVCEKVRKQGKGGEGEEERMSEGGFVSGSIRRNKRSLDGNKYTFVLLVSMKKHNFISLSWKVGEFAWKVGKFGKVGFPCQHCMDGCRKDLWNKFSMVWLMVFFPQVAAIDQYCSP